MIKVNVFALTIALLTACVIGCQIGLRDGRKLGRDAGYRACLGEQDDDLPRVVRRDVDNVKAPR